jgi:hypothetical protein
MVTLSFCTGTEEGPASEGHPCPHPFSLVPNFYAFPWLALKGIRISTAKYG